MAAANRIDLEIVTPTGRAFHEQVAAVTAVSEIGEFCVLPEHRPILAALGAGRLAVDRGGEVALFAVDRGFLAGGPDRVSIITQRCAAAADIDGAAVDRELGELTGRLAALPEDDASRVHVEDDLAWARARLGVAGR
jgi:F-type H+-transporting ATPase subunit epsilon